LEVRILPGEPTPPAVSYDHFEETWLSTRKYRAHESRLIAINGGEGNSTATDVSAVYPTNRGQTKHSVPSRRVVSLN